MAAERSGRRPWLDRRVLAGLTVAVLGIALVTMPRWRDRDGEVPYEAIAKCTQPTVATAPPIEPGGSVAVELEPVSEVSQGTALAPWVDGRSLIVSQRLGAVWRIDPTGGRAERLLDLGDGLVLNEEGGLIGMAVAPDGEHVYLHVTDREGASELLEYEVQGDRIAAGSRRLVLRQPHPAKVHNGGALAFDAAGHLYLGFGDGGGRPSDAERVASLEHWDGKILRIDPHRDGDRGYTVPDDNPFVGVAGARPEIWSRGLRNPYQLSIDPATDTMWIGDAGELCFEEIDAVSLDDPGVDFGFPRFEAFHEFLGGPVEEARFPVHSYQHGNGGCAVIGGLVLHDPGLPDLDGAYLFGDLCSGRLQVLAPAPVGYSLIDLDARAEGVHAFGAGPDDETYVLSTSGVFRLVAPSATGG